MRWNPFLSAVYAAGYVRAIGLLSNYVTTIRVSVLLNAL